MERKAFQDRFNALKHEAQSWRPAWTDLQAYIAPTRGFFENSQPNKGTMIDHKKIINGHSLRALTTLASGMTSGLTSPSRPWFKLSLADPDLADNGPVKEWLTTVQQRMMMVYSKSNIYGVLNSLYSEIGAFGTAAVLIMEDFHDVIRARSFTTGEYYLGCGPDGRVNSFARKFWMTVGQLVKEFGKENVSENVKTAYSQPGGATGYDRWVSVCHLIEPNDTRVVDRKDFSGKAYRSIYWEESSPTDTFLKKSGFDEFPVLAPRWTTTTTADVYGRSPGWDALGDVKMLQKMEKDKLIALDKMVDPPVQKDSGVDEVNLLPGGVTTSSASVPNAGVKAIYQVQPDFQAIENSIMRTEQRIDRAFYADLFMMIANADRPDMTAREIVERHEEKLLMLGPVLERLESELLDPLIDRTFNIMLKAGLIPPPPDELQGMDMNVEYISMLAQAQKMVGTTAIEQLARFAGSLVAVYPDSVDMIDADEAIRDYGDMLGVPPRIVRAMEDVAQIRDQKAQQAQAAQAAQTAQNVIQGAQTLSKTPVGQNSALDAVMAGLNGSEPPPGGE